MQWALGMDDSGPIEVWTEGEKFDPPTYAEPESARPRQRALQPAQGLLPLCRATWWWNWATARPAAESSSAKGARSPSTPASACPTRPRLAIEPIKRGQLGSDLGNAHLQNWLDCIKSRQQPIADVEIGHRSATVCHLGNIARWTGRKLRWDPVKEVFPDDAEANEYLDRPRRKPYELPETA